MFQNNILSWYQQNKRHLPWRKTSDPYRILISEVMLQQTQVDRVIMHYERWLKKFPNIHVLARAHQKTVLKEWSGLGYNRRALNLHRCAREVMKNHKGKLPKNTTELESLPGIGKYTAHAICAFAYQQPLATVDTNIARIHHRIFIGAEVPQKELNPTEEWELADTLYPKTSKRHNTWNHALMDFGALICTKRSPYCHLCPFQEICSAQSRIHGTLQQYYREKLKPLEPGNEEEGKYIPNRIFRGRIIEYLRKIKQVNISTIGPIIKKDFSENDLPWLLEIIEKLEADKLIQIAKRNNGFDITLK